MKSLSLLIKPVSSGCQMSCSYCFYKDVASLRSCSDYGRMQKEFVQALLERVFQAADEDAVITFAFQGGEPLLAGLSFYEHFISMLNQLCTPNQTIHYAIQTNGYMLDEAWCSFFHTNNFLVGISLDGWKQQHDRFRTRNGSGTYVKVMRAIQLLRRYHVSFNILSVLTRQLAQKPEKLYAFYKEHGFTHVQLIPCLAPLQGVSDTCSLTPELFYRFYRGFFDIWLQDNMKKQYMSVSLFDNLLRLLQGDTRQLTCGMLGACQFQYIVESDGSLYPCDFYVLDEYRCGNVMDTDLHTALHSKQAAACLKQEEPVRCHTCPFQPICHGNCKRLRSVFMNPQQCGYQQFLLYAYPKLKTLADKDVLHKLQGRQSA